MLYPRRWFRCISNLQRSLQLDLPPLLSTSTYFTQTPFAPQFLDSTPSAIPHSSLFSNRPPICRFISRIDQAAPRLGYVNEQRRSLNSPATPAKAGIIPGPQRNTTTTLRIPRHVIEFPGADESSFVVDIESLILHLQPSICNTFAQYQTKLEIPTVRNPYNHPPCLATTATARPSKADSVAALLPSRPSITSSAADPTALQLPRRLRSPVPSPQLQPKTSVAACRFPPSAYPEPHLHRPTHFPSVHDEAASQPPAQIQSTRTPLMTKKAPLAATQRPPSPAACPSAPKHYDGPSQTAAQAQMVDLPPTQPPSPHHSPQSPQALVRGPSPEAPQAEEELVLPRRLRKNHIRQALHQSPEQHLTIPFPLVQVKVVASTGLSNLDPVPRAPSLNRSAPISRSRCMNVLRA